jgi:hypothetical protein
LHFVKLEPQTLGLAFYVGDRGMRRILERRIRGPDRLPSGAEMLSKKPGSDASRQEQRGAGGPGSE